MAEDEDRELRRHFAAQRREELEEAPPFRRVWAAARASRANGRPRRRGRLAAAAAAALTLALLALLWRRPERGPAPDPETSASIAQWKSPTDFLLATPGRELLSTVPSLGAPSITGLSLPMPPAKPSSTPKGAIS
jgi:hypothetical protein